MLRPAILLSAALCALGIVVVWPFDMAQRSALMAGLAGLALGAAVASVIVWLLRGLWRRARPEAAVSAILTGPVIVVDGSNVMHWDAGEASARTLSLVLADLRSRGFAPQVFFDANVGYKLAGRHLDPSDLAQMLGLPVAQVAVSPSGTPADPVLLDYAVRAGARVVTNDRFMDWRADFPAIRGRGFLVKGEVRGDRVALRL